LQPEAWKTIRERLLPEGRVMASLGPARQQDGSMSQRAVSALNAMHEAFEGQVLVWEPSTAAVPEGGLGIAGLPALALTGGCASHMTFTSAAAAAMATHWLPCLT
jgi:hypothetical protein